MKVKWCQYFENIPIINFIASVFDPRTRLNGLKDYLKIYYECLNKQVDVNSIVGLRFPEASLFWW